MNQSELPGANATRGGGWVAWLTVDEIAAHLQISKAKAYELARAGDLPATKVGNQWRFDREQIDHWLRERGASVKDRGGRSSH